jgi:hypothetical protein
MTENFTDYQIKIKDAVYKVPMPVKEILDSGWAFGYGEDPEKSLNTGETNDTFFISKDGAIMYATIINFYDEEQKEIEIALDLKLTPVQNAQKYYNEYRKADTAEKKLSAFQYGCSQHNGHRHQK